jgi:positive regulator of sigma E activity
MGNNCSRSDVEFRNPPCMKNTKFVILGLLVSALLVCALLFDFYSLLEIILVIAFITMTRLAYILIRNLEKEYKNSKR